MTENSNEGAAGIKLEQKNIRTVLGLKYDSIMDQYRVDNKLVELRGSSKRILPFLLNHPNERVNIMQLFEEQWSGKTSHITAVVSAIKAFNSDMNNIFPDGEVGAVRLNRERFGKDAYVFFCKKLDSFTEVEEMLKV